MANTTFHIGAIYFRSYSDALVVAQITERMTGDVCKVEDNGPMLYRVMRDAGWGKMVPA